MSRAESLEASIHGRPRSYDPSDLSEAHFGVHEDILYARGAVEGGQWSGVCTGVALAALEGGLVDAVVVASSAEGGFGGGEPLLAYTAEEVMRGRRVKPSLCPSLAVLDQVKAGRRG